MALVDRGSHQIYFEVHGERQRPALLLVMGLGFSSRGWVHLPERLASEFRVITFDNRGTGRSTLSNNFFTVADMADDAAAVLDAACVRTAHVFGISMGGMVALELALRQRARVETLTLGATHAGFLGSQKPSLSTLLEFSRGALYHGSVSHSRLASFLVSPDYFASDAQGFARWLGEAEHTSKATVVRQVAAVARHRTETRLRGLRLPTLIVSGDADVLVPVSNSRQLAKHIAGARIVEFPGVGHCFPLEREHETAQLLASFCREFQGAT